MTWYTSCLPEATGVRLRLPNGHALLGSGKHHLGGHQMRTKKRDNIFRGELGTAPLNPHLNLTELISLRRACAGHQRRVQLVVALLTSRRGRRVQTAGSARLRRTAGRRAVGRLRAGTARTTARRPARPPGRHTSCAQSICSNARQP